MIQSHRESPTEEGKGKDVIRSVSEIIFVEPFQKIAMKIM